MSLLDGRDEITIHVPVFSDDDWGTKTPTGTRTEKVTGTIIWGTPATASDLTVVPGTAVRVIAREWSGVSGCKFECGGAWFEQDGVTEHFHGSPLTEHYEVRGVLIENPPLG